jgi:hypothetical protein
VSLIWFDIYFVDVLHLCTVKNKSSILPKVHLYKGLKISISNTIYIYIILKTSVINEDGKIFAEVFYLLKLSPHIQFIDSECKQRCEKKDNTKQSKVDRFFFSLDSPTQ